MWNTAHDAYMESRVLSANPLELVKLLYQGAIGAVQDARHHLADGKIQERSRAITRAYNILTELNASLDRKSGGEIAGRLGALYNYMQRRLLEANFQQSDPPLEEVLRLLSTLAEAWNRIAQTTPARQQGDKPWPRPLPPESAAAYASGSWSF